MAPLRALLAITAMALWHGDREKAKMAKVRGMKSRRAHACFLDLYQMLLQNSEKIASIRLVSFASNHGLFAPLDAKDVNYVPARLFFEPAESNFDVKMVCHGGYYDNVSGHWLPSRFALEKLPRRQPSDRSLILADGRGPCIMLSGRHDMSCLKRFNSPRVFEHPGSNKAA